jgi:hypothetical protein
MSQLYDPIINEQLARLGFDVLDTCQCVFKFGHGPPGSVECCFASGNVAEEVASLDEGSLVEVTLECIGRIEYPVCDSSVMETVVRRLTTVGFAVRRLSTGGGRTL